MGDGDGCPPRDQAEPFDSRCALSITAMLMEIKDQFHSAFI